MANYFNEETDKSIVAFNSLPDGYERDLLFTTKILPAFEKLSENITNIYYNSQYQYSKEDVKSEVLTQLFLAMRTYDEKHGKGFAYFNFSGVNYLRHHFNTSIRKKKYETNIIDGDDEREDNIILIAEEPSIDNSDVIVQKVITYLDHKIKSGKSKLYSKYVAVPTEVRRLLVNGYDFDKMCDVNRELQKVTPYNSRQLSTLLILLRNDIKKNSGVCISKNKRKNRVDWYKRNNDKILLKQRENYQKHREEILATKRLS